MTDKRHPLARMVALDEEIAAGMSPEDADAYMFAPRKGRKPARATTVQQGVVHDGPVPEGDAPQLLDTSPKQSP